MYIKLQQGGLLGIPFDPHNAARLGQDNVHTPTWRLASCEFPYETFRYSSGFWRRWRGRTDSELRLVVNRTVWAGWHKRSNWGSPTPILWPQPPGVFYDTLGGTDFPNAPSGVLYVSWVVVCGRAQALHPCAQNCVRSLASPHPIDISTLTFYWTRWSHFNSRTRSGAVGTLTERH